MKTYHVIQSFLIAPTNEDPSVNSGLDTWSFDNEAAAIAHFQTLITDLQNDPDYQAGVQADGLEIIHTQGNATDHVYHIDLSQNGVPVEAVYVEVVSVNENEALTWWSKQRDQHQQRVIAHFSTANQYVVVQSAVADDAASNLVASSIITWTFGTFAQAKALVEMLQSALQEDYAPIDEGSVRIVHFTSLKSELDYRIEVSENGVPTEAIMVELYTIKPHTDAETWWSTHCQQHEAVMTKRFFSSKN
ncbi:MAG: hypothetical protein ACRC17_07760 [Culicoidibacterales bacterium]